MAEDLLPSAASLSAYRKTIDDEVSDEVKCEVPLKFSALPMDDIMVLKQARISISLEYFGVVVVVALMDKNMAAAQLNRPK